ncbi:hypothetical protein PISL3812_03175 [Talaromyces islandicus]|uniref:Mid2 domain-containing protein n=1 Tax=Talaromyces islandicus TaxID=28573 RepID=A0A0U1LSR2_TALIS|nr:hypothetical protein PISL3812_03175 [Talaromyces islandicus]
MLAWNLFGCFWLPIWALLWSVSLQQDDQTFAFVNPPPSQSSIQQPVYEVGDPIDIQWVGTNTFVSVRLVHVMPADLNVDEFIYVFDNVTNLGGHFTWVIDLGGMNLTISNTFFFNIFIEGETAPRAMSHNITLANSSTSTTTLSTTATATHTTLSTSTTKTSVPAATTTPPPTTSSASPNSGLDSGAKAGIGVGVAVGALAVIAAGFFFWRRSRAVNAAAGGGGGAGGGNAPPPNYQPVNQEAYGGYYKAPPPEAPSELSDGTPRQPPSELLGSGSTAHEMADTSRG